MLPSSIPVADDISISLNTVQQHKRKLGRSASNFVLDYPLYLSIAIIKLEGLMLL